MPTVREICAHFDYRSPKAAQDLLAVLIRKKFIRKVPGKARSIQILRREGLGIPLVGSISAGLPVESMMIEGTTLDMSARKFGLSPANAFALKVSGDSMTGRHIIDGDIVILEKSAMPREGEIVAALLDGESLLKTYLTKNGVACLRAENPKYKDLIPAWDITIQGVARGLLRSWGK